MTMKTFIVAEVSSNHGGDFERCKDLILAAKDAFADAVKLQIYDPSRMVRDKEYVIESGPWAGKNLYCLYQDAQTPSEWYMELVELSDRIGIELFSSVYDREDVDLLESYECPRYKISSFELTDLRLLRHVAETGKPVIFSTGMANELEIIKAHETLENNGCRDITLLLCVSAYPAPAADARLKRLDLFKRIGWPVDPCSVGLSDHTLGSGVACAAAVLGATVFEKHLTLNRAIKTPDSHFSMEPHEFSEYVANIHDAVDSIGTGDFAPIDSEAPSLKLRRSLYFARDVAEGSKIARDDICTARPAQGIHPHELPGVLGRTVKRTMEAGEPVTWECLS